MAELVRLGKWWWGGVGAGTGVGVGGGREEENTEQTSQDSPKTNV